MNKAGVCGSAALAMAMAIEAAAAAAAMKATLLVTELYQTGSIEVNPIQTKEREKYKDDDDDDETIDAQTSKG